MTSDQNDRLPGQILQGDYHDILPEDSFTAQRLKHASACHLHLTTRRVFIGPIPEAWIADHRKSWVNYRPRVLTYSSKTASFNAAKTVPELRALTGLDPGQNNSRKHKISFPQPADVDDAASSDTNIQHVGRQATSPAPSQTTSGLDSTGTPGPVETSPTDSYDSAGPESYITAPSNPRGAKSFVTAHERLEPTAKASENVQGNDMPIKDMKSKPVDEESGNSTTMKYSPESIGDKSVQKKGSSESTQALLTQDQRKAQTDSQRKSKSKAQEPSALGKQPNKPDVLLEIEPEAYEDNDMAEVTNAEPTRKGKVRFSLSENAASKSDRLRDRVSNAKEKIIEGSRKSKAEPGQLLKAERMLVRVDVSKHDIPDDYSEKHSAKAETKLLEKWREYMVTCRKGTDGDGFVLHMSKSRVIPLFASERISKRVAYEISLKPLLTRVNLFSPLDKTIVVWEANKKATRIFILRPRSSASSIEWLMFLNLILGYTIPDKLRISVPDLDVVLEVFNPLNGSEIFENGSEETNDTVASNGDKQKLLNEGDIAKRIIGRALQVLEDSDFQNVLDTWQEKDERLGLAWRQYDRLEWLHGANENHMYSVLAMQKTHELEIRPKMHYPTIATTESPGTGREQLNEPAPIEGFLVLQTSQHGRESLMGKNYFRRLYFSTHNHLLCFSTPGRAIPPKPPELKQALQDGKPKAKVLAEKIPLIYPIDPYPIQDGKITWLSDSNSQEIEEHDHRAYEESDRALHLMLEAEGYIDLCHIKHVRKYKPQKDGEPEANDMQQDDSEDENELATDTAASKYDIQRSFVLYLTNGLTVRLQAYDKIARKEWVKRLRALSEYWKHRTAEDVNVLKEIRQQNLTSLGIDEEMESIVGQIAEKWEVSKSVASSELFHMCGISCCRQITV